MLEWVGRQGLSPQGQGHHPPLPQYSILFESKLVDRKQGTSRRLPGFGLLHDMGQVTNLSGPSFLICRVLPLVQSIYSANV